MDQTQDILESCKQRTAQAFPTGSSDRLAEETAIYLAHVAQGASLRQLARVLGKHPSTVMRLVRRLEQRRDDPLFDQLLSGVETALETKSQVPANDNRSPAAGSEAVAMPIDEIRREARKYLRRLAEPSTFMFIAQDAQRAGVFTTLHGNPRPIATLPVKVAAEFLKQDWIKASTRGNSSVRYKITDAGRSFLKRTIAEEQERRITESGMAEAASPFQHQHKEMGERLFADPSGGKAVAKPVNQTESPLGWLARRKDRDGKPFLAPEQVEAGERLRDDFEAAQMGPRIAQDWSRFLAPTDRGAGSPVPTGPCDGPQAARDRVHSALSNLGPGLADVVMRTCCFLEGLETCERRYGWSARSGKVVLKIALERLAEHYGLKVFRD